MITAPVQGDIDGIAKGSHCARLSLIRKPGNDALDLVCDEGQDLTIRLGVLSATVPRGRFPTMAATEFPNTPRGRLARSLDGRCPVHGAALRVSPGFASRMDLLPSHEFEAMQRALPFCLDLGESFEGGARCDPAAVIWCPDCVAAVPGFRSPMRL